MADPTPDPVVLTPEQRRRNWYMVFGAFTVLPVILTLVAVAQRSGPPMDEPGTIKTVFYVIGVMGAIAGAVAAKSLDPPESGFEQKRSENQRLRFMTLSVIPLALAEMATLMGFIGKMSGTFESIEVISMVALNLAVNFLFVLPRGLVFWKSQVR
jgi:hypothetical protein